MEKNNIKLSRKDFESLDVKVYWGGTPLEVAEIIQSKNQLIFPIPFSDNKSFLVASPIPHTSNFLVRFKNHGQIFKNSAEASLCFVDLVGECLDTFFGEDDNECLLSDN